MKESRLEEGGGVDFKRHFCSTSVARDLDLGRSPLIYITSPHHSHHDHHQESARQKGSSFPVSESNMWCEHFRERLIVQATTPNKPPGAQC